MRRRLAHGNSTLIAALVFAGIACFAVTGVVVWSMVRSEPQTQIPASGTSSDDEASVIGTTVPQPVIEDEQQPENSKPDLSPQPSQPDGVESDPVSVNYDRFDDTTLVSIRLVFVDQFGELFECSVQASFEGRYWGDDEYEPTAILGALTDLPWGLDGREQPVFLLRSGASESRISGNTRQSNGLTWCAMSADELRAIAAAASVAMKWHIREVEFTPAQRDQVSRFLQTMADLQFEN